MSGGGHVTGAVVVAVTLLHAATGVLSAIDGEYDLAKLQILLAVTTAGAGLLLREVVRLRRLAKTPHGVSWGKGFLEGMAAWESLNASILANDMRQDHHQTHGNGPVSAEERASGLGDDGLTNEERQEFLSRFERGIGSKRINDGATGAERGEG